jgi:3-phosphoshikimate 1-carboxyvinyltransferase
VLAALSDGPGVISGVLRSRDSELMIAGLAALGVGIEDLDFDTVRVTPPTAGFTPAPQGIDVGLAGTVMRFLPPVAALAPGTTSFFGDERASQRPLAPLLDALAQLGVSIDSPTGSVPFSLTPPTAALGSQACIDSSASSQFISGMLLTASRFPAGLDLRHEGASVPSLPHIEMTVAMAERHGALIHTPEPNRWVVEPRQLAAVDERVEPDLTNAAAFLIAAVITDGAVRMYWPSVTTQPGDEILGILSRFGAHVQRDLATATVTVTGSGMLHGDTLDLSAASELTPVVAGLAAFAKGQTRITGVGHIRGHETDRITAIVSTLRAVGVPAEETDDGLVIGVPVDSYPALMSQLHAADLPTFADHRIAHLAALLGLRIPGVRLIDVATTAKTMPDFPQRWAAMVAGS